MGQQVRETGEGVEKCLSGLLGAVNLQLRRPWKARIRPFEALPATI